MDDLSWIPDNWWYLVTGNKRRQKDKDKVLPPNPAASPKTLNRHFKQAKTVCRQTQQVIRQVTSN
jgi:hypothetical protein